MAPSTEGVQRPTVGRVVHYRAKTRGYVLPAIVTATRDSLDPDGVRLGHVPDLAGDMQVHLHVLTPGAQGSYSEHAIGFSDAPVPGTWGWPPRA